MEKCNFLRNKQWTLSLDVSIARLSEDVIQKGEITEDTAPVIGMENGERKES